MIKFSQKYTRNNPENGRSRGFLLDTHVLLRPLIVNKDFLMNSLITLIRKHTDIEDLQEISSPLRDA